MGHGLGILFFFIVASGLAQNNLITGYDAASGSLPDQQAYSLTNPGGPGAAYAAVSAGVLHTAQAGYFKHFPGAYDFNSPTNAYVLEAKLHIVASDYSTDGRIQRAGYCLQAYDSVGSGFELGISSGGVFLNTDAAGAVGQNIAFMPFNTTDAFHDYQLVTHGGTVSLYIDGNLIGSTALVQRLSLGPEIGFGNLAGALGTETGAAELHTVTFSNTLFILTTSVNSATNCGAGAAVLTATTTASNPSYLWSPGGATNAYITVSPASTTTYTVLVTDGASGYTNSAAGTVTVQPGVSASVNSATTCSGDAVLLTATTSANNPSYLWIPGAATTPSIIVSPTNTATYTVIVTDGNTGCTTSGSGTVTVNPLPTVSVSSVITCPGEPVELTVTTSASNPSYLWSPGGATTASLQVNPTLTTTYSVMVTDGTTGCKNSGSGTLTVKTPAAGNYFFGDSVTEGYLIAPTNRFSTLICNALGLVESNLAVGGSQIIDSGESDVITALTIYPTNQSIWFAGYVDQWYYGTNAAAVSDNTAALYYLSAWLAIPTANRVPATDPGISYNGSWGSFANTLGVELKFSASAGASVTFTATGTTLVIGTARGGGGGNLTAVVDGNTTNTFACLRTSLPSYAGRDYSAGLIVFTNLSDTSHTVVLTAQTGGYTYFGWYVAYSTNQLPKVVLCGTLNMPQGGYNDAGPAFANASPAAAAAYSLALSNVAVTLAAAKLNVVWTNAPVLDTNTDFEPDFVHPNEKGDIVLENQLLPLLSSISIISQPLPATQSIGETAAFSVAATGPNLSYQWQANNGSGYVNVSAGSGGTTANYATANLSLADNGTHYRCVITPGCNIPVFTPSVTLTMVAAKYRTVSSSGSGTWALPSTWERSVDGGVSYAGAVVTPTDANAGEIRVRNGFIVVVAASQQAGQLVVEAGGQVVINSSQILTITDGAGTNLDVAGALDVAGTLNLGTPATAIVESNGILSLDTGTSLIGGNGAVTINSGGILRGVGTINCAAIMNGTLSPGNSATGTLKFNYPLTLAGTALLEISKSGTTLTADKSIVAAALSYGGSLAVSASGTTLAAGDSFTLFNAFSFSHWFNATTLPGLATGLSWDTNKLATTGVLDIYPFAFTNAAITLSTYSNTTARLLIAKILTRIASARGTPWLSSVGSAANGTLTATASSINYTPSADYLGGDSFYCMVSDGSGTIAIPVLVNVLNPQDQSSAGSGSNLVIRQLEGGGMRIIIVGAAGKAYLLQYSDSMMPANWQNLGAAFLMPDAGLTNVDDTSGSGSRYYRTVSP